MSNDRLRAGLLAAGMTHVELAQRVGVDPKTVDRWVARGRLPHREIRRKVASALNQDEVYLWPEVLDDHRSRASTSAEFVTVYPNRGQVPPDLWTGMVERAEVALDLLVFAGLFWFDAHPDLIRRLGERADAGLSVRLLIGDPDSAAVGRRGVEEGIDMAGRCRMTLGLINPLLSHRRVEVRLHDTTLYASLYRGDDMLLANTHVYGAPAACSPVLHLQRVEGGRLFDHYRQSFERVWQLGTPYRTRDDRPDVSLALTAME
jgi:hypothetical protein